MPAPPRRRLHVLMLAFAALALLGAPPTALGQPAAADAQIAFDIPAQPLDAALAQYFRATGVQLLYDSALTAGRRSSAISGRYAPREALRRILADTGLVVRYSRSNAAIITGVEGRTAATSLVPLGRVVVREKAAERAASSSERLAYYSQLEQALQTRLETDPRTARLAFQVTASLRVDEAGQVTELRLERGSGVRETDRLLALVLTGAPVAKPPPGLAQPLLVSLRGRRRG